MSDGGGRSHARSGEGSGRDDRSPWRSCSMLAGCRVLPGGPRAGRSAPIPPCAGISGRPSTSTSPAGRTPGRWCRRSCGRRPRGRMLGEGRGRSTWTACSLNQNLTGLYSVGENPVAAFREKLEAAARDGRGPGGGRPDQQPRRRRHGLRHHGRGAAAVPRGDRQAGRRLPDGPGHRRGVLPGRRLRPGRRPPDGDHRRGRGDRQPLQPPGRDGPAQRHGRPDQGGRPGRHGLRDDPPGRRGPHAPPGDGRRLPRPLRREGRPAPARHDRRPTARPSPTAASSPRPGPWRCTWSTGSATSTTRSPRPSGWRASSAPRSSSSSAPG